MDVSSSAANIVDSDADAATGAGAAAAFFAKPNEILAGSLLTGTSALGAASAGA